MGVVISNFKQVQDIRLPYVVTRSFNIAFKLISAYLTQSVNLIVEYFLKNYSAVYCCPGITPTEQLTKEKKRNLTTLLILFCCA